MSADDERAPYLAPLGQDPGDDLAYGLASDARDAAEGTSDRSVVAENVGTQPITDDFVRAVLAAVVDMALRSKRRQADLDAALWRAGVKAGRAERMAAVARLGELGCVERVVELSDGGVLLSVTGLGLERLGGGPHGLNGPVRPAPRPARAPPPARPRLPATASIRRLSAPPLCATPGVRIRPPGSGRTGRASARRPPRPGA